MEEGFKFNSLIPDYSLGNLKEYLGYIISALLGVIMILVIFKILSKINLKKNTKGE